MTRQNEEKVYHANPSIIDFLPWAEFLDEEQCLLLDDGVSVGAVYDVTPVATEGRTEERLEQSVTRLRMHFRTALMNMT